jgi:hypothetical protein
VSAPRPHRLGRGAALLVAACAALGALPAPAKPAARPRAVLVIACDDRAAVLVNGEKVGEVTQWDLPLSIDVSRDLFPMVVAVEALNHGGPGALVGALRRTAPDGATTEVAATWRCTNVAVEGWELPSFDDGGWKPATDVTPSGAPPWGPSAGAGLERASAVWLDPPAGANETLYCRARVE